MNLQTAIVEDSKPDAERLKQLLKKAFENENISCSCFASGDEFLRAGWREGYQVVFLDICMEGTNGIETAQRLRAADPDLLIVFVTSSPEYVWDAFPVHPFDYLLKPYKDEKFEQLAGELRRVLCRQQPELEVRIARQIVRLPLTKIYYLRHRTIMCVWSRMTASAGPRQILHRCRNSFRPSRNFWCATAA